MSQGPSLADIAAQCQVSKATVSKVLARQSDRYRIGEETRTKVLAAAKALGFEMDWKRRQAATRRTHVIAVLFHRVPFTLGSWSELPALLADALHQHGYRLMYAPLTEGLAGWMRGQFHHTCDGAILIDPLPTDLHLLPNLGLPVVALNEMTDQAIVHVTPDEAQGMTLAVTHLRDLGHRHIVFQRVPFNNRHPSAIAREQATHATAAALGLTCESWVGVEAPEVVRRLQAGHRVTALVCYCHVDALLVLHALVQAGVPVPGRVSVMTVDRTWYTRFTNPPLAALAVPATEICVTAVQRLVEQIEGREETHREHVTVPYQLIPDASCGRPPQD
jgi:DNA-binding LacI/PurR family transcriptional regulator